MPNENEQITQENDQKPNIKVEIKQEYDSSEQYPESDSNFVKVEPLSTPQDLVKSEPECYDDEDEQKYYISKDDLQKLGAPVSEDAVAETSDQASGNKSESDKGKGKQSVPRICPYCNMNFPNSKNFKRHVMSHTDERPFQCALCDSKFKGKYHLTVHIKTHTGTEEAPGPSKIPKTCDVLDRPLAEEELLYFLEGSEYENDALKKCTNNDLDLHHDLDFDLDSSSDSEDEKLETSTQEWSYVAIPSQKFPFTKKTGLLLDVKNSMCPIDYFNILATEEFFQMLCTRTNSHAADLIALHCKEQPRIAEWQNVNISEMRTFLGLLFHMGTLRLNKIDDYWSEHHLFNLQCFSRVMSRTRFRLILTALYFEGDSRTRLGKITPLLDFFNGRMEKIYYPWRELSIEESEIPYLNVRRYKKDSKRECDIKLYALCEPSGMTLKINVYTGCDRKLSARKIEKIVLSLLDGKLGQGHSVYMEKRYNSVDLTQELLKRGTYVTGMLKLDRKNNPEEVVKIKLKTGDYFDRFNSQGICVTKWRDKRDILAISSEYNAQLQRVQTPDERVKQKPNLINKYDKFVARVGRCDQISSFYPCEHEPLIWYKKLAIHIFQMMLLNSYYFYKQGNKRNRKNFYDYRLCVIEGLLGPSLAKTLPEVSVGHLPELCPKRGKSKRRKCEFCWENGEIGKDSFYYCPSCPTQPGLCLTPCFREFHLKQ